MSKQKYCKEKPTIGWKRIDSWGAIVFKDGMITNVETPHQNMLETVGWADTKTILYPECDRRDFSFDFMRERSRCEDCPKMKQNDDGTYTDCNGTKHLSLDFYSFITDNWHLRPLEASRYAFFGDEELTVTFYEHTCEFLINKELVKEYRPMGCTPLGDFFDGYDSNNNPVRKKVFHGEIKEVCGGVKFKITRVDEYVSTIEMRYKDHNYFAIFGGNINPCIGDWVRTCDKYYTKKLSEKIARLIVKHSYADLDNYYTLGVASRRVLVDIDVEEGSAGVVFGMSIPTVLMTLKLQYNFDPMEDGHPVYFGDLVDIKNALNYHYGYKKFDVIPLKEYLNRICVDD